MIFRLLIIFTLLITYQFPFPGQQEVEALYAQINDIYHPTLEDYQKIEDYLFWGERPYLGFYKENRIPESTEGRVNKKSARHLKLIGPDQNPPLRSIYHLNTSADDKSRCYCLYASYNKPYPKMIQSHLKQLKKVGFKGHVLLYTGGYPNLGRGGLKLSHIYYGWKYAVVEEAYQLGYQQVVWADTAMCALNNLDKLFESIKSTGVVLIRSGKPISLLIDKSYIREEVVHSLGITNPHETTLIKGAFIGFDFSHQIARDFLKKWGELTQNPVNSASFYPDECILTATAYHLGIENFPSTEGMDNPYHNRYYIHQRKNWKW